MAEESTYPIVTELLATHRVRLILDPLGGALGTGSIQADALLASALVAGTINSDAVASVGAAITPGTNFLTKTLSGGLINLDIDQLFKDRVSALEAKSLIQIKDASTNSAIAYMNLPGGTGNYLSTPNNSAFNVATDTCVVVRFKKPSSTPGANMTIVGRWNSTPGAAAWRLVLLTTGQFRFTYTVDGTAVSLLSTSAATPLAFDGAYIWLKVRRLSSTSDTGFWTAADTGSNNVLPTSWTAFQLNRTSIVGSIYNNAGALSLPLTIGAYNAGASEPFTGQIGRVLWYSGTDELTGTLIVDANAADYVSGTTWTSPLGRVWTLVGTATVVQGASSATANTTAEFSLGETDAFATIPFAYHDTFLWSTEATLVNTSGSNVNFTPKLKVAGADMFTFAAISIPSAASSVYNLGCAVKLGVNAADGTSQIARAELVVNNAVTGTDAGSISMASPLANLSGNRLAAIATMTSIPQVQLRMTMGTAAATISARALRSQLYLAKA